MSDEIAELEQESDRGHWLMRLALGVASLAVTGLFFLWLLYLYLLHVTSGYQETGCLFADKIGRAIVATHSEQEMLDVILPQCSPDLRESTSKEQFDEIYTTYTSLGKFQSYVGTKDGGKITFEYKHGFHVVGVYHVTAVFEHGDLEMTMTLHHERLDWQIVGLYYGIKPL